jgi:hypothetical protein
MVHRTNRLREIRQSWGRAEPGRTRMAPADIAFLLAEIDCLEHRQSPLWNMDPAELAQMFHETHETLAPVHGRKTPMPGAVAWDDVPEGNRNLMVETCKVVLAYLASAPGR